MNWMKVRPLYFAISAIALALSVYAIAMWGFRLSIDFTGGSVVEYRFADKPDKDVVEDQARQNTQHELKGIKVLENGLELRFTPEFTQSNAQELQAKLSGSPEIIRFETVGPALSSEILQKTYVALAIATIGIMLWVAWQFKSIQFGVSAVLATLHDTIILLGTLAALGHFRGVEVDILSVTALLTVLSFSVHDTIVVYDRIRETRRRKGGESIAQIANQSLTDTMVRSFNNSMTIVFMLLALFLMGGETIKWFVLMLLVGTVSGTYSSPFVAVPLLVSWDELKRKIRR